MTSRCLRPCQPRLQELHLCSNDISHFSAGDAEEEEAGARAVGGGGGADADGNGFVRGFEGLHTLVLNDNNFSAWLLLRLQDRRPGEPGVIWQ